MPRPEVEIRQAAPLFFGSGTTAPVSFDIAVANRGSEPLIVRRIRVESPGMVQYGVYPREEIYRETIPPGQTKTLALNATAWASQSRLQPSEPLSLRAMIDFESEGKHFREIYQGRGGPP